MTEQTTQRPTIELTSTYLDGPGSFKHGKAYWGGKIIAQRLPRADNAFLNAYGRSNKQQRQEIADALAEPDETAIVTERQSYYPRMRSFKITFTKADAA